MENHEDTKESLKEEIESYESQTKKLKYTPTKETYHNETFDYTEANKIALTKQPKKLQEDEYAFVDPLDKLTPQQRKLHDIRQKLGKTKQDIYTTVVSEHKKLTQGENYDDEIEEKRKLYNEKIKKEEQELKSKGLDPNQEKLKNVTIEDLEKLNSKKKKKKNKKSESQGETIAGEHIYNSYKKRVREMEQFKDSDHFKPVVKDVSILPNELNYGESLSIPSENINAMKQELLKNQQLRSKSFKKKGVNPDEDVSYVNEENRVYNEKLSRAYDKYTLETRQNLERGTAL